MAQKEEKTKFISAILNCDLDMVGSYLDRYPHRINKYIRYDTMFTKCTPVFLSVAKADYYTVKLLISRGADVNIPAYLQKGLFQMKLNAFTYECQYSSHKNFKVLELLAKAGADVDSPVSHVRVAEEEGGTQDYHDSKVHDTCLHWAVLNYCHKLVEQLLQLGANANLRSSSGETCLHYACENSDARLVELIIKAGGVTHERDRFNYTPLTRILMSENYHSTQRLNLVRLLMAAGYCLDNETWLMPQRRALSEGRLQESMDTLYQHLQDNPTSFFYTQYSVYEHCGRDILLWLLLWPHNPKSLKFYSRLTIRQTLGHQCLNQKLDNLGLPASLLRYINLDIID